MGVDLMTYRARIGTYRHSTGVDVLTVTCYIPFLTGMKTIGSVLFIGLLLLAAGIEPNPGPNGKAIQVTGLPDSIDAEYLEYFFAKTKKSGGGIVEHVELDTQTNSAVVQFEDPEAVERILEKLPITILNTKVTITAFNNDKESSDTELSSAEYASLSRDHHVSSAEYSSLPAVSQDPHWKNSQISSAEDSSLPAVTIDSHPISSDQQKLEFNNLLNRFGLKDKFPEKITTTDVVSIDVNDLGKEDFEKETNTPWIFLRRLISTQTDAIMETSIVHEDDAFSIGTDEAFLSTSTLKKQPDISPLDLWSVVFQCCDPALKQLLVKKLYLCKMPSPFLYIDYAHDSICPSLAIWPLRTLIIESVNLRDRKASNEEVVLQLPTKTVAFARFGRPLFSKSQFLNCLLSTHGCKAFFNVESLSGTTQRFISNGQVEIFWLPTVGDKRDKFEDFVTFFNLRGNLLTDFSICTIPFMTKIVDVIVIVIDQHTFFKTYESEFQQLVKQFSSVVLIIPNPLQQSEIEKITKFEKSFSLNNNKGKIKILCTYKGNREQNLITKVSIVSRYLVEHLKTVEFDTCLEQRLASANILKKATDEEKSANILKITTDEDKNICQRGKQKAKQMIELMKEEGQPNSWKQTITPVQGKFSRQLGELIRQRAQGKSVEEIETIENKIRSVRLTQINNITKSLRLFAKCMVEESEDDFNFQSIEYFLGWLQYYIEKEKRMVLPQIMIDYRNEWGKLKEVKANCDIKPEEIIKQQELLSQIQNKIDEASFSIANLFRELGFIYDSLLVSNTNVESMLLPALPEITKTIGRCILNGHQFELIEGDSFYMPYKWIECIFNRTDLFSSKKVFTLSVLGLQGSGKSTLLNTMFGSQFSVRTGRCTSGILLQLIPVKSKFDEHEFSPFQYIAVLDTEGLRSPELSNIKLEHDNELATVITGLGDITMLNIMGENAIEIKDVLQIVVHAFLRLKRTNESLNTLKGCCFVHQNVTDSSASDKMLSGLNKLLQTLDEMTHMSARTEGILDITSFNQVIQFDSNSQVWYIKNLWQGNPPMASVNNEYSDRILEIKKTVIQNAIVMKEKYNYKTIQDILVQGHDLWKGILHEDFVFSFRNGLEIKVYIEMDNYVQNLFWNLERSVHEKLINLTFGECNQKDTLMLKIHEAEKEFSDFLLERKKEAEKDMCSYFDDNKYNDIIVKWKQPQQYRLDIVCLKIEKLIKDKIDQQSDKRSVEILTVSNRSSHENDLWMKSIQVATLHRGHKLNQNDIDKLFNEIWVTFVENVMPLSQQIKHAVIDLKRDFIQCLYKIAEPEKGLVTDYLRNSNAFSERPMFRRLKLSFSRTGIDENDISTEWKGVVLLQKKSSLIEEVADKINNVFALMDSKLTLLKKKDDYITEIEVNECMHFFKENVANIPYHSLNCDVKKSFYVKLYVHVGTFLFFEFEEHNAIYRQVKGTEAVLDVYKKQQQKCFEDHLHNRKFEETIVSLFCEVIEKFLCDRAIYIIEGKVLDYLYSKVPNVKHRLIVEILTDLVNNGNFENFISYIKTPKIYAEGWLRKKCICFLYETENEGFATIERKVLSDLYSRVRNCIDSMRSLYNGKHLNTRVEEFVDNFLKLIADDNLNIPKEHFRIVHRETEYITDIELICNSINETLSSSEDECIKTRTNTSTDTVTWPDKNPIDVFINRVWGCPDNCAFCGEPCAISFDHVSWNHYSLQHRPSCCKGVKRNTRSACLESCNFDVQSAQKHECKVFNYICNNYEGPCAKRFHLYRDFKKYLNNWNIEPSTNMHETSKFWMWFVAEYKKNLKDFYQYKLAVPKSWTYITEQEALDSLNAIYCS